VPLAHVRSETRWAAVVRRTVARARPERVAPGLATLRALTPEGTANVVVVTAVARGGGGLWARVELPILPNGTEGWIPRTVRPADADRDAGDDHMSPRVVAALGATLPLLALPPARAAGVPMWTTEKTVARIDEARVVIGEWRGRVQAETTVCSGRGASARWGRERHWRHFTCTWTPVTRTGRVEGDVTFRVRIAAANGVRITHAHFGST